MKYYIKITIIGLRCPQNWSFCAYIIVNIFKQTLVEYEALLKYGT